MARQPLEAFFGSLLGARRNTRVRPTQTIGTPGTAIFGGYVVENEVDAALSDRERYRTFSRALANTSIVAAGVRYFLNLCAKAGWTFVPADHPEGMRLAEMAEQMMTQDPETGWARIVRRAAMYRFYGFSIQEWTARRRSDGALTFLDVAPRAQITIERWDVNNDGTINGVVQRSPQDQQEIYLPRGKLVYLVDDTLNDSPQGLGLFRHIVEPVHRLNRYEQLEGFGFETDLRGVPVGRAPYSELRQQVNSGEISAADAQRAVAPIEKFVEKHVKKPDLGLLIDSAVFETTDEAQRPSNQPKFALDLLDGPQTALPEIGRAIERVNREIARILGVEALLLGADSRGSNALSRDKTNQFSLTVDATLSELAEAFTTDLLRVLWQLNGWPDEAMPELRPEAVQYRDVDQIAAALRDMAQAGAVIDPSDPAVNEVRSLVGLSPTNAIPDAENVMIGASDRETEGTPDDPEEELPERNNQNEGGG